MKIEQKYIRQSGSYSFLIRFLISNSISSCTKYSNSQWKLYHNWVQNSNPLCLIFDGDIHFTRSFYVLMSRSIDWCYLCSEQQITGYCSTITSQSFHREENCWYLIKSAVYTSAGKTITRWYINIKFNSTS